VVERVRLKVWSVAAAAEAAGVTERTIYRWLARFRDEGEAGLVDRRPVARHQPAKTPVERVVLICQLRRLWMTGAEIAEVLEMPISTVSAVLRREGLGKRSRLEPLEPPNRYERRAPGELIHIDIKKLGRIQGGAGKRSGQRRRHQPRRTDAAGRRHATAGWECVHVAVDDHSRLAYAEVFADEKATSAVAFLRNAVAFFAGHGITVERVMTDNGPAYLADIHRLACIELGIRHLLTKPYRPRTNGKAERFIQTLVNRWAYGRIYRSSAERTAALGAWLDHYNYIRPHGSLGKQPPASRLTNAARNNS
jgi:transposase InsO family protein